MAPIDANFLMDSAKRVYSLVHDLGRNYLVFRDMVDTTEKKLEDMINIFIEERSLFWNITDREFHICKMFSV